MTGPSVQTVQTAARAPDAGGHRPRLRTRSRFRRESATAWVFVAPVTIGFAIFILLPFVMTIYFSFTKYDLFSPPKVVGASNYSALLHDQRLVRSYLNTALFSIMAVPLNVGLGLLLAVAVNRRMPRWISVVIRSLFFAPTLIGLLFIAIVWQFFFQTDNGIFNYYLGLVGIGPIHWLSSTTWAIPSIVLLDVWKNVGLAMLILLAGLHEGLLRGRQHRWRVGGPPIPLDHLAAVVPAVVLRLDPVPHRRGQGVRLDRGSDQRGSR
jgi:multiple sugar transport system permease protein